MKFVSASWKLSLLICTPICAQGAFAQDEIPEIVVTSPSPIFTRLPDGATGASGGQWRDIPVGVLPVVTDTFSPVTVIPRADIERNAPKTLGEALGDRPGVNASSYAPGASRPVIRGLDSVRVRVQENGVGVHDVSEIGDDHGVPIDPLAAEQIEVIRGPATLRYGSQAIGGVVSAINNRIPTFIPVNNYLGRITGNFGTADTSGDGSFSVDAGKGQVAVHADGFIRRASDYSTPLGVQANSGFKAQGGSLGASYLFDRGFFGVSYTHYESVYGIPGGEAAENRTRIDLHQEKVQARGEYRPEGGPFEAFRFWLGGTNYKHDELGYDGGVDGVRATFKNREIEGRIEAQHVPVATSFGTLRGAVGVQLDARKLGTAGEAGGLLGPANGRSAAAYVFEELELSKTVRLQGAARIESDRLSGISTAFPPDLLPGAVDPIDTPARRNFAPKSVSAGILKDLPHGIVASLNAQYVERAPTAAELFAHGAHDATGTFEIGDVNLKKEVARTVEFALRRKEGPLRFDAAFYATRYTGFVYRRFTGIACGEDFSTCNNGVDTEFKQIVYSQANATFHGFDLATQYDAMELNGGYLGVDGRFDFVRARFDDGTNVPRIPPYRLGGGVFWRNADWFARVGLLHAFAQNDTATLETRTPGYNLLKAELSYTRQLPPGFGFKSMTFNILGDNLLNVVARDAVSFKKDEIVLPGRTVRAGMTLRF